MIKQYLQFVLNKQSSKVNNPRKPNYSRRIKRNLLNNNLLIQIYNESKNKKHILTLKSFKPLYQKKHNLNFSLITLRRHLRENLNMRFRKVTIANERINKLENKITEKIFINEFLHAKKNGHHFIYIDESGFCNTRKSKKGWVKLNEEIKIFGNCRIKQVNLIFSHDEMRGIEKLINLNTVNKGVFLDFLQNLLNKIKLDFDLKEKHKLKKITLIIDNAKIHKGNEIREFCINNELNILYLPPYMPMFNPIETVFSLMKKEFYLYEYSNQ